MKNKYKIISIDMSKLSNMERIEYLNLYSRMGSNHLSRRELFRYNKLRKKLKSRVEYIPKDKHNRVPKFSFEPKKVLL